MRACSGCRPLPTPGRTCFPTMSTWTSHRPRDAARMGPVCGHGRDLGHPVPADQDRRGRIDTGQPGLLADGDRRRVAGLLVGFVGVAVLVGLNVSFKDLRSVGEVGLVALGYAAGPIIIARRLPSLPAVGVVAASLVLTALFYSPVAIPQLPSAMPSRQVLLAVLTLAVVCTALGFLLFFALISEVGPVRATVITYFNPAVALL